MRTVRNGSPSARGGDLGATRPGGCTRAGRPVTLALLALVLAAPVALAPVAVPAVAVEGLAETTHSRYVLDADDARVQATVTTTIRNTTPPSGGYLYYYDEYGIPVPAGAEDVRATSDGVSLPVTTVGTEDPSTATASTGFAPLHHGRSRTIEWTFVIPGEPVRSADYTRVGPGYATFTVQAAGDPGQTSVDVVVPSRMTFDATGDAFEAQRDGATTTYSASEATDPHGTWAVVSARDPKQADRSEVTVGDTTVTLQSFPGDRRWTAFVAEQLERGLPALEDAVGHPWPGGVETVREDVSPQALGYAWFDPGADEIVVPEDLDAALLYHELSHAWLNPDELTGRWLYEGLAETVAYRVLDVTGAEGSDPRKAPDRDGDAAVALTGWSEGEPDLAAEDYAYAASYTAVQRLLGDLDDPTFAAVVAAALAGESAYEATGSDEHNGERTDWRRFLDLVEVRGGVEDAAATYRRWVVDDGQRAALRDRGPALADYTTTDDADGAWLPPLALRTAMTDWKFDRAAGLVRTLGEAPAEAAAVQEAARSAGIDVPAVVRDAYQDANTKDELAALSALLPRAADVVTSTGAARSAAEQDRDPVSRLGAVVLRVDPTADRAAERLADGDLDEAAALAATVQDRTRWAPLAGVAVLVLAVGTLAALGAWARRAAGRRQDAVDGGGADPDETPGADAGSVRR